MAEKIDARRQESVEIFIQESIRETNESWSKFTSPFLKVPHISDLYKIYKSNGEALREELESVIATDRTDQEKKDEIYNILLIRCNRQRKEMDENLTKLQQGTEVTEYLGG